MLPLLIKKKTVKSNNRFSFPGTSAFTMQIDSSVNPFITFQGVGNISIDWGDNTGLDNYTLTSSNLVVNHSYASGGTKTVRIYNSKNITKFETATNNNYSFDLKDLKKFNKNFYIFRVFASNIISGNLLSLSALYSLTYFQIIDSNTISGDLSNLSGLNSLNICQIVGSNRISDYTTSIWSQTGLNYFKVEPTIGYGLSSTEVDQLLIDIDAGVTWSGTNKTLWIAGNNAPRTSASDAAVLSLQAKGVTVTTN